MSNNKESLKKSLGINDYPWSSDDEVPAEENPEDNSGLTQSPENGPSIGDLPGTSGEPPLQPTPLAGPSIPPPRNRTISQVQAKKDRDMFWSLLNHRTSLFNATRPMRHTPAPDLIERPHIMSPAMDIQRILALKRNISRGYNTRPRIRPNTTFYAVPATRSNTYPVRSPSYATSSLGHGSNSHSRSAILWPAHRRARAVINNHYSGASGLMLMEDAWGSSGGLTSGDVRRVQHAHLAQHAQHAHYVQHAQHAHPAHVDTLADTFADAYADTLADNTLSDDDIDSPGPSTSPADNNNDDNNADQDNNDNVGDMTQNTADGAISLEEEIVEMDAAEVTIVDRDAGMDEGGQNDDETQEITTRNSNEVILSESADQPHGVKRKRDGNADINTPYTVKDFNQCLLRLLECPVCLEWMEPPIAQCRRGHLVCGRCRGRLASCPVCRTTFSSVRNRAMEGVAEMLRYPCRHGCGREVRLRRRGPHEASCPARKYYCPAPACMHRNPLPRDQLATHFQSKHLSMLKIGSMHKFTIKINAELSDDWLIMSLDELFHLRVDVDIRTWGVIVYVAYIGPKCNATNFMYEVTVDGHHQARRLNYTRATHSDLDIATLNLSRHDCFNLTLDQALNFLRFSTRNSDSERFLDFSVEVKKCIQPVDTNEDVDS